MSRPRFDSSRMLPLFQIIAPHSYTGNVHTATTMPTTEAQQKYKKAYKQPDVPVHKSSSNNNDVVATHQIPIHKNHHKSKSKQYQEENVNSEPPKLKRKHLKKEIDKITEQNLLLQEQLTLTQTLLTKKDAQISKLKEKITLIKDNNREIIKENEIIKTQYQDLLISIEEFKRQNENKKCSTCGELHQHLKTQTANLEFMKNTNKDLNEDLNMLKNVVYRLNVQLERYQQKLLNKQNPLTASTNTLNVSPLPLETDIDQIDNQQSNNQMRSDLNNQHHDHLHTPISWGNVNSHTLGPLLDAYQDTIKEKEEIIANYEFEMGKFTEKLKIVTDENEMLHKKIIEAVENVKKDALIMENNRKELKVTKEQNDLLIKKCALKHDKLQDICKIYDHKIETMKRDYEVLQEQFHKTRMELSIVQGRYQSLSEENESFKSNKNDVIPLSVHTASVNECKRLFEELKTQYESEKAKLLNQLKILESRSRDMEINLEEFTKEKIELQTKIKNSEKQVKKLEIKLTQTSNALSHSQISKEACKRQLKKAIDFGKELINDQESLLHQLSSRQNENKMVKQIGSSISSRMDLLKSQLKTVQKNAYQQLASVEQRIQEQDSSIESMKKEHENEVEKLLQEINDKDALIGKLIEQSSALPPAPYLLYREKQMHLS